MIYKKGVLRNFTKFTGKHLFQSLFFNKIAGLKPPTLLKNRLWYRCFPVNFAKFLVSVTGIVPRDVHYFIFHLQTCCRPSYRWYFDGWYRYFNVLCRFTFLKLFPFSLPSFFKLLLIFTMFFVYNSSHFSTKFRKFRSSQWRCSVRKNVL